VPGLVLAFGYLAISVSLKAKKHPGLPIWLNVQEMPVVFLVIAYAARRLPYVVRSTVAGLQQTPIDMELAAANLGASRWNVLRRITLPLILANLIAGALLAFAFALLEVKRFDHPGAKVRVFPDHPRYFGVISAPRRRHVHRQRPGRLGDAAAGDHADGRQRIARKKRWGRSSEFEFTFRGELRDEFRDGIVLHQKFAKLRPARR